MAQCTDCGTDTAPHVNEQVLSFVADRCEELVALNQDVIDALTGTYMARRHLEFAMQYTDNLQSLMAALYTAQSEERQAVAARDKHREEHWCGGGSLARAAGA